MVLFPPNGAWLLIFDSHLRLAEYGRLRIDSFSIAPAGSFCSAIVVIPSVHCSRGVFTDKYIDMVSTTFRELGLSAPILRQLEKLEYKTPTPIQAACIPLLLQNRDLMGLAQTGTGKTAAFALPLIQQFSEQPRKPLARQVRALILSPTRELAAQIHDNICAYAKELNLSTAVIFGGVGYAPQFKKLAGGLDILVATPGRLIDHLERQTVSLRAVETLILDEADHMLDMGFAPALKKIVSKIPQERHTQMFSATMPDNIRQLAQSLLHEPETVMVTPPAATADRVEQSLCMVPTQAEKRPVTLDLLEQQEQPGRTLIFTRTKHGANRLASFLTGKDYPASAIHGDKSQGTRERMLREFRSGETPILVATDIAARGIDVKDVQLVINYDLPEEPEVYVHRIGRTARAGAAGQAIALCSPDETGKAKGIHKLLGRVLPVHPSSEEFPRELLTVPGTQRERRNSAQENRSASRRGPQKGYGRSHAAGRQRSHTGA